jgi:hypothetical protein
LPHPRRRSHATSGNASNAIKTHGYSQIIGDPYANISTPTIKTALNSIFAQSRKKTNPLIKP